MTQQTVEKVIRVDVIASANAQKNIEMMAASLKKIDKSADEMRDKLDKSFGGLENIIGRVTGVLAAFGVSFAAGAIIRGILDMSSAYEVLESRLKLVLGSQRAATQASREIVDIAVRTGKDMDGTAKLYEKASRAAMQFGHDQSVASKITESFANSIRLSGSSTQEAYAAMVQFGQALASGRLQGDEFRSLMENNSVFMYEFANAAGKSVTELRKLGSEGKLSSSFLFDTMLKKGADGLTLLERLNKMAAEVPLTFRQSAASVGTQVTALVGEMAKIATLGGGDGDKLGVFGPVIRGLQNMTTQIRDMKIEMEAAGKTGFWDKLWAAAKFLNGNISLTPGGVFGITDGLFKDNRSVGEKLSANAASVRKELAETEANLQKLQARATNGSLTESGRAGVDRMIDSQQKKAAELRDALAKYEVQLDRLSREAKFGGDPYYTSPKDPKKPDKPEPTKEQKAAADALKDFIEKIREEAKAMEMLKSGQAESSEVAKKLTHFEKLLADAKADKNSKTAQEIRQLIIKDAFDKKQLEVQADLLKARDKEIQSIDENILKVQEQIDKDNASIEALKNKTKASQEYTSAKMKEDRETLSGRVNTLYDFSADPKNDPVIVALEAQIKKIDEAIAKRKELEGAQLDKQVRDDTDKFNKEKEKEHEQLVDQINNALKKGVAGSKNPGKTLLENIRDEFKNKAIDVIINPVTTMASRILAKFADEVGAYLSRVVLESMANSSSDPIGSMASSRGWTSGGSSGSAMGTFFREGFKWVTSLFGFDTGIRSVPFDDMPARLHRGERVLTRQENNALREGELGGRRVQISYAPNIYIDARSDAAQVQQMVNESVQTGNRKLVEDLTAQGIL